MKMHRLIYKLMTPVLALIFLYGSSFVSLASDKIYIVAGDNNFPPYEFVDQDGAYKGFNVDLMKAVSLFTDIQIEFRPMAWEEAYGSLENGSADIIQGMKVTDNRKNKFIYSNTLVFNTDSLFVLESDREIESLSDLSGRLIGIDYGDSYDPRLDKIPDSRMIVYDNTESVLKALVGGEVDAVVGDTLAVNFFLLRHGMENEVKVVGDAFNERAYAIAVSKNNPELMGKINSGISIVKENGTYDQLYRKWFGKPRPDASKRIRLILSVAAVIMMIALTVIAIYNRLNHNLKMVLAREIEQQKKINEKLREYDKMQFMDKVISSIAHEIRNPLTSIRLYTEQIPKKIDNREFMMAVAEDVPPEIDRIDMLIKEFIEYTSPRKPERRVLSVADEVENTLSFSHNQLKEVDVTVDIQDALCIVFDRNHFRQVLLNILLNGIDAVAESGEPKIRISAEKEEGRVMITVTDNGCGISEDGMKYLFDPFFTTKSCGNGLGLFVVRQLVEENGGKIEARREEQGTSFVIYMESGESDGETVDCG
ncbi:transporter substrate-binding domain-containing protein [Clostridium transplantifaecale]|uniref:transporter substrate-binding domain-containing protein n=1 Tax=Clostridium transplantifaecale TaxID=2479838 RepID=UPI000F631917|nr:transporter substrate-binding domain-containing protein [Clostridium transplantifaecale]